VTDGAVVTKISILNLVQWATVTLWNVPDRPAYFGI